MGDGVALAVRQLESMKIKDFRAEDAVRYCLAVLYALRSGTPPEDIPASPFSLLYPCVALAIHQLENMKMPDFRAEDVVLYCFDALFALRSGTPPEDLPTLPVSLLYPFTVCEDIPWTPFVAASLSRALQRTAWRYADEVLWAPGEMSPRRLAGFAPGGFVSSFAAAEASRLAASIHVDEWRCFKDLIAVYTGNVVGSPRSRWTAILLLGTSVDWSLPDPVLTKTDVRIMRQTARTFGWSLQCVPLSKLWAWSQSLKDPALGTLLADWCPALAKRDKERLPPTFHNTVRGKLYELAWAPGQAILGCDVVGEAIQVRNYEALWDCLCRVPPPKNVKREMHVELVHAGFVPLDIDDCYTVPADFYEGTDYSIGATPPVPGLYFERTEAALYRLSAPWSRALRSASASVASE